MAQACLIYKQTNKHEQAFYQAKSELSMIGLVHLQPQTLGKGVVTSSLSLRMAKNKDIHPKPKFSVQMDFKSDETSYICMKLEY